MIKIEFLFPELVTLYGETGNLKYLSKCLPEARIVTTQHGQRPAFVDGSVDFVYIGSMIDNYLGIAIRGLKPYRYDLERYINSGKIFLATGNALDLFGQYIDWGNQEVKGLGIFDFYSKGNMDERHNSWFLGEFEDMKIVANRGTFIREYGGDSEQFIRLLKGEGMNSRCRFDGVRRYNFYATSLLGPLLVMNPPFTQYLLDLLGDGHTLWEKDTAMEAYNNRILAVSAL